MISAIIIDDEKHCIGSLKILLSRTFPNIQVCGTAKNGKEGLALINQLNPQLVFLDIAMPVMGGFEMLSKIEDPRFELIFTTAFNDFAIKAFHVNASDYLLKPIIREELERAVSKCLKRLELGRENIRIQDLLHYVQNNNSPNNQLAIPTLEGYHMVKMKDIFFVEAEGNYSNIYFKKGKPLLVTRSLKRLEEDLMGDMFVRIHRKTIVNLQHVSKYFKGEGGYVVLSNQRHLDVSRRRKEILLARLRS